MTKTHKRNRLLLSSLMICCGICFCLFCGKEERVRYPLSIGIAVCIALGALSFLHFRMPRLISWLFFVVVPISAFYLMELLTHNPLEIIISRLILEYIFFLLLYLMFFFLTGRQKIGFLLANLFVLAVGIANYYVLDFRSNPILPWDLSSLSIAMNVADNFVFSGSWRMMYSVLGFALLSILVLKSDFRVSSWKQSILCCGVMLLTLFGYTKWICTDTVREVFQVYDIPFTQWYTYRMNGFFVSFLENTRYLNVEKPEDYSPESVQETLDASTDSDASAESDEQPDILVIMNEAFSDLSVLGDFETSEPVIPFFQSLQEDENTISGLLYVSVLGGNTANTEFEFLTGDTCAFLPTGSIAYQQFIQDEVPALPAILDQCGYDTAAFHPYGASGWNRDRVYPLFGFGECSFLGDFHKTARLRSYVTDESLYDNILDRISEQDETPLFSFAVTMQNHGSYSKTFANFTPDISITEPEIDAPYAEAYLSLIHESDRALEDLISQLETSDRKTIVVFFGDHQPSLLETSFFQQLLGEDPSELDLESTAKRYQVPFVIWANYPIAGQKDIQLSANYLSTLVSETAQLPLTAYQQYLKSLYAELPVITANFYIGADEVLHATGEESAYTEQIEEYASIQYNNLFDAENRADGFLEAE